MNLMAGLTKELEQLIESIRPSLVIVRGRRFGAAAGLVWSTDGLILTNNHVVGRKPPIVRLNDDGEFESRILARDREADLVLLEIAAKDLPAAVPADRPVRIGELVLALGHPWGQRDYVTSGIVSALSTARTRGKRGSLPIIRTDVTLAPGNSGGPLVNMAGQVIGINAMIVGGDQSYAIPVSVVREFVEKAKVDLVASGQRRLVSEAVM